MLHIKTIKGILDMIREGLNKKNIKSYGIFHTGCVSIFRNFFRKKNFYRRGGGKILMENSITFNVFFI